MTDSIIDEIKSGRLNEVNISFAAIKQIAGRDYDIWNELGRGRSILSSQKQLDQYLYSYGPMIKNQWAIFQKIIISIDDFKKFEIIDYACGQGLASILFLDSGMYFGTFLKIILIEPSLIALNRAKEILKCYRPKSQIITINKKLDDLVISDLETTEESIKIHLFSNILDIDCFSQTQLLNRVFSQKGTHYLLAVSHDRNFAGGSQQLHDIFNMITDDKCIDWYKIKQSHIEKFNCDDGKPAIYFFLEIEI